MTQAGSQIKFVIGSRQIFGVSRPMRAISYSLEHLIDQTEPQFPATEADQHGYRILSAPLCKYADIVGRHPGYIAGGLQRYRRYYIDMSASYDGYLSRFSSKTRSTFNRKKRKLAEYSGGNLDIREFRTPAELEEFLAYALPLSAQTYQARLLDAGLPESAGEREKMLSLAADDSVRAYILFAHGKAISYLYLPVVNNVIVYAFLGYDPAAANLSPGTVLQLEALERLFAEKRYRLFDFTEGEGAHKQMFGTDHVEACSFFLMKGKLANRMLLGSLAVFDAGVASAKRLAERSSLGSEIRRRLRG
jgi:CelD/BcsL family acetyltransferase involved in cellulose biosynthesis